MDREEWMLRGLKTKLETSGCWLRWRYIDCVKSAIPSSNDFLAISSKTGLTFSITSSTFKSSSGKSSTLCARESWKQNQENNRRRMLTTGCLWRTCACLERWSVSGSAVASLENWTRTRSDRESQEGPTSRPHYLPDLSTALCYFPDRTFCHQPVLACNTAHLVLTLSQCNPISGGPFDFNI